MLNVVECLSNKFVFCYIITATHSHSPASLTTSTDLHLENSDFKKLELRPISSMAHQIDQINFKIIFYIFDLLYV